MKYFDFELREKYVVTEHLTENEDIRFNLIVRKVICLKLTRAVCMRHEFLIYTWHHKSSMGVQATRTTLFYPARPPTLPPSPTHPLQTFLDTDINITWTNIWDTSSTDSGASPCFRLKIYHSLILAADGQSVWVVVFASLTRFLAAVF